MNSLRFRLAALLVGLILALELGLTAATLVVIGPPGPGHSIDPLAGQVAVVAELARTADGARGFSPSRPAGDVEPGLTDWLRDALKRAGESVEATVIRPEPPEPFLVAFPVEGRGWFSMPIPDLPPRAGLGPLPRYLGSIALVAIVVALFAASRITRPLALLNGAVARVDAEGGLPRLPETGPAEVSATAAALNRLSDKLRAAMESRMRLVAAAGHDLRTPLTRMRLRAEFADPSERDAWIADLDEMSRIADSAIALVREEVSEEPAAPLRLDELARDVAAELSALGMPVRAGALDPAEIRARPLALRRALRNLAINGATHGGGAIVRVARAGDRALAIVEDDGPGVPEPELPRVQEPFFRADPARTASAPGAGLGISIAREIVTRAGGTLTIANRAPHGLRAEASFPCAGPAAAL